MHYAMIALATASIACLAATRSRAILTEWLPMLLMAAGMVAMATMPLPVVSAALMLTSALFFSRGPKRQASLHRGLASVAMAALAMTHVPVRIGAETGTHHAGSPAGMVWVVVGCVALALGTTIVGLVRVPAAKDRRGRRANNRLHRTEALLMGAGVVAMTLPI